MSSDTRAKIEAANREFMGAFGRGDAAAVAKLYTAGGQLLPANSDVVEGTDAIQGFWQGALGMGLQGAKLETLEVDPLGDTAVEIGRYTLTVASGAVADTGKYLVVWKNDGGTWKLHRDIWTTSQPAAATL